jgi:glycosyltransferase involved in cell wall biosynthesis
MQNHSSFIYNRIWLDERRVRNRLLHALGRWLVHKADTHRVLTRGEKRHYLAMGIPEDRVAVLPTPTHVDLFTNPVPAERLVALRERHAIPPDSLVILWVGLPVAFKNVDLLLNAYRHVKAVRSDACLIMVGNFDQRPQFVECAKSAGVIFPGRVAHNNLPAYYQLADVYAHSSRYEGFGKVMVEALAAGTPVVATRTDGSCAIIRDGETGLLVDHTLDVLADSILSLLNDPARAKAMGESGQRDVIARFDYNRQLDAIVETFRHTLEIANRKESPIP